MMYLSARSYKNALAAIFLIVLLAAPCSAGSHMTNYECDIDENANLSNEVLVQVFVYGLSAFNFDFDPTSAALKLVTAYFPETPPIPSQGRHLLFVFQGIEEDGNLTLKTAALHPAGDIELDLVGPLQMENLANGNQREPYPEDCNAARDARWILDVDEIDETASIDADSYQARLYMRGGNLETCALLVDETLNQFNACRAQAITDTDTSDPRFHPRTISEVMVLRSIINAEDSSCSADESKPCLTMTLEKSGQDIEFNSVSLPNCSDETKHNCVYWDGTYYSNVIDVMLAHIDLSKLGLMSRDKRRVKSNHAGHLKKLFRNAKYNEWDIKSPDCSGPDYDDCQDAMRNTSNCEAVQPLCWGHLKKYLTEESLWAERDIGITNIVSTLDASACPLVGYP